MRHCTIFIAILAVTLAGCGNRDQNTEQQEQETSAPAFTAEKKFVAATDEYGLGLSDVTSIAFWSHPKIVFNSLVIAGHGDGITLFNIEDGATVSSVEGFRVTDLEVGYIGKGAAAIGYLAVATDDENDPVRFYQISNADRSLQLLSTIFVAAADENAKICLGSNKTDGLALGRSRPQGTTILPLTFSTAGVSSSDGFSSTSKTLDCAFDENGAIYAVDTDGNIVTLKQGGVSTLIGNAVPNPTTIAVSTKENEAGNNQSRLIVLDDAGRAHLFDANDGHAVGAIGMRDTFDITALESVTSLAVGQGNYGGIYRDGALAFVDGDATGAPIKLAPWGGVIRELDLSLGTTVNPRGQVPVLEEDEAVISIDLVQP